MWRDSNSHAQQASCRLDIPSFPMHQRCNKAPSHWRASWFEYEVPGKCENKNQTSERLETPGCRLWLLQQAEKLKGAGVVNWPPHLTACGKFLKQSTSLCWQRAPLWSSFQSGEFLNWAIQGTWKITAQRVLGLSAAVSAWESATRGKLSEEEGRKGQSSSLYWFTTATPLNQVHLKNKTPNPTKWELKLEQLLGCKQW
jgi:hypothetical protein